MNNCKVQFKFTVFRVELFGVELPACTFVRNKNSTLQTWHGKKSTQKTRHSKKSTLKTRHQKLHTITVVFSHWPFGSGRILKTRDVYLIFLTTLRGFLRRNFWEGHNYRTHLSADLLRYSYFLLSNYLEKQYLYIFSLTALRGFVERKFSEKFYLPYLSKQTWSGALSCRWRNISRDAISYLCFFYFLKGFHIQDIFSQNH